MTTRSLFVLIVALFLLAPHAMAQDDRDPLEPVDGDPCPGMTAEECFWGSGDPYNGSGPVPVTCSALARSNQACKDCVQNYDPVTGQPSGYPFCGFVKQSASCDCIKANTPTCSGRGSCYYHS